MRRSAMILSLGPLLVAGCAGEAATGDAGRDAPSRGRVDAPADGDVDAPLPSPVPRPDWAPILEPACGERSASPDERSTYDTRRELARAIAEAECAAAVRCGRSTIACNPVYTFAGSVDPELDLDAAEACLRAYDEWDCSGFEPVDRCLTLRPGVGDDGARCTDWAGCATHCFNPTGGDCAGICAAEAPPLHECATACGDDEGCGAKGCELLPTVGESCELGCDAFFCPRYSPCRGDAYCDVGICTAWPGDGEPCLRDPFSGGSLCGPGRVCDLDGTCWPPRTRLDGEACGGADVCDGGLVCDRFERRCHPPAPEGGACDTTVRSTPQCEPGLFCAGDDPNVPGRCDPLLPPGAPCPRPDACAAPNLCITTAVSASPHCAVWAGPGCTCDASHLCPDYFECRDGVCAFLELHGGPCESEDQCIPGQSCIAGRCELAVIGQPCTPFHSCAEGMCSVRDPRSAERGLCIPTREHGEACRSDEECSHPDRCTAGRCGFAPDVVVCE